MSDCCLAPSEPILVISKRGNVRWRRCQVWKKPTPTEWLAH